MPNQALANALRMKADESTMAPTAARVEDEEPETCRCPKCGYEGPCEEFQQEVTGGE